MAKIKLNGDTSGYIEISAPAVSGNNTLELGPGTRILTNLDNTFTGVSTFTSGLHVTGGSFGLGTDNPQKQLQILGDSDTCIRVTSTAGGYSSIQFGDTADTVRGGVTYYSGDDSLELRGYNNSTRLRITSAGLVGVNCTPLAQFQVKAGANANISLTTMSSEAAIEAYNDAGSANVSLRLRGSDLKFFTGSTERLRITSAGDVGIGINAPTTGNIASQAKFIHIHNSATTTHSPAEIYFTNANSGSSGGAGGLITFYNTGFYFWNYANDDIVFGTGGSERFKFDHSANTLDFISTSKIRLQGGQNSGGTLAHINIGSDGGASSDTRAIDVWGNWQDQESKSITYNHGTGTSDMVCQQRVRYDQSPSRTNYEIGRFYHGQNTTAFPFQLQSTSTTTADLTIDGNVLHKTAAFVARSTLSNNITSTTRQKIDYTVDHSYQGVFNNSNDRFTAQKTGLYFFYARHWFGSNSTGTVYMDWLKNGALIKEFRVTHPTVSGEYETIQGSGMIYMAVNDYLEVYARSDGNGIFHESNGAAYSEFSGFYVSGG